MNTTASWRAGFFIQLKQPMMAAIQAEGRSTHGDIFEIRSRAGRARDGAEAAMG